MNGRKYKRILYCITLVGLLGLVGCGSPLSASMETVFEEETSENEAEKEDAVEEIINVKELTFMGSTELVYAQNFAIDNYNDGIKILRTMDGTQIMVVPEKVELSDACELSKETIVIRQPVENLYLVASAVMDIFDRLEAVETIRFSGQKQDGWYVSSAREAMASGKMLYAGKYNKPDYELIVSEKCSLAIENTMINHTPEVKEMLGQFDIPVMVDYSSYENHPLARVEWVKFYGALLGKEEAAENIFAEQMAVVDQVTADEKAGKTVAYFNVTSNGLIQVRQSADYIPKMIELAGGKYVFENIGDEDSMRSTMNMQIEEFYDGAKNADFLIYNSSIDGGIQNIEQLLDKCSVLSDFKAVQQGNVWCTTNDMYQQSMSIGEMIADMHKMICEKDEEMKYLYHLGNE